MKRKQGFIALISIIMISAVISILIIEATLTVTSIRNIIVDNHSKEQNTYIIQSCADVALLRIQDGLPATNCNIQ